MAKRSDLGGGEIGLLLSGNLSSLPLLSPPLGFLSLERDLLRLLRSLLESRLLLLL